LGEYAYHVIDQGAFMNHSFTRLDVPLTLRTAIKAARAAARTMLAHVHETIIAHASARDRAEVDGMTAHLLRDIGADTFRGSRVLRRELEYPRF
jgi:hypothetical protein